MMIDNNYYMVCTRGNENGGRKLFSRDSQIDFRSKGGREVEIYTYNIRVASQER